MAKKITLITLIFFALALLTFFVIQSYFSSPNTSSKSSLSSSSELSSNSSTQTFSADLAGKELTDLFAQANIKLGFLSSTRFTDFNEAFPLPNPPQNQQFSTLPSWQPQSLSQLIPPVSQPQKTGKLVWEKYGVDAPLQYAPFSDIYEANTDGTINFTKPLDTFLIASPIQQRLRNGIVHLPLSPLPGEVGNSYIIGHTSNYENVESAYNFVFAPLLQKVQIGEEFTITDHRSRRLTFKVFETLEVDENDLGKAYQEFQNRRVVTLQGSILENGIPTKRYLIRAELVFNP